MLTSTKRVQEVVVFSCGDGQQPTDAPTDASSATTVKTKKGVASKAKSQRDAAAKEKAAAKVASKDKAKIATDNPTAQGKSVCEQVNASISHS